MSNRESLRQLKSAEKIAAKPAYLQKVGTETGFYAFNYNPESYTDKITANYSSVSAATASIPYLDYSSGSGTTRTFNGLLMDTYSDKLSLRVIIDGIKDLMIAHPEKGEYEPPDLMFIWGSESFKPCKLIDFSYTISHWLGGEPAKGTADLTLTLVPDNDPAKIKSTVSGGAIAPTRLGANNRISFLPPSSLSEVVTLLTSRQKTEGMAIALTELKSKIQKLSPNIRNTIKIGKYEIKIDDLGVATLLDLKGNLLNKIGKYDGFNFISELLKK